MESVRSLWTWVNENPALAAIIGTVVGGLILTGIMGVFNWLKETFDNRKLSDDSKRQLNAYYHKLKRLIDVGELLDELIDKDVKLEEQQKRIEAENIKQKNAEEYKIILRHRKEWDLKMIKLSNKMQQIAIEFNHLPNDEIPPGIHAKIMEIVEHKKIQLDLKQQKELLKKIEEVI